jgi:hypothetical protein
LSGGFGISSAQSEHTFYLGRYDNFRMAKSMTVPISPDQVSNFLSEVESSLVRLHEEISNEEVVCTLEKTLVFLESHCDDHALFSYDTFCKNAYEGSSSIEWLLFRPRASCAHCHWAIHPAQLPCRSRTDMRSDNFARSYSNPGRDSCLRSCHPGDIPGEITMLENVSRALQQHSVGLIQALPRL